MPKCYTLINCNGTYFNSTISLLNTYLNDYIVITIDGQQSTWFVFANSGTCNNVFNDFGIDDTFPVECDCRCFEVIGSPSTVTYVDCDKQLVKGIGASKFCALTYPIVTGEPGTYQISEGSNCVDKECPIICYKLTNCTTGEIIYSTSQNLSQYVITSSILTLSGYEGCWQVLNLNEEEICDCPVNVTVLQVFSSCSACLPTINYKFTNCNNQSIIRYSTNDYSAYVGKTVELECGGCWFVSEINYVPPSTQTIDILYTFDNCAACAKTYYELTNCLDDTKIIYTSSAITLNPIDPTNCDCIKVTYVINNQTVTLETLYQPSLPGYVFSLGGINIFQIIWNDDTEVWDLTYGRVGRPELIGTLDNSSDCPFGNFVINSTGIGENITSLFVEPCTPDTIISIKECPGCWIVTETREPINPTTVTQLETYGDCEECAPVLPCLCSRITNYSTTSKNYEYTDCNDQTVTFTLQPNKSSDKLCVQSWQINYPDTDNLEVFGDCVAPVKFNWVCPIIVPVKKVKPGYSTPSCNIEKYEKITCKSSEIYYKQVMRLRYGISNCCPEDEEKWLVKKELIDLQALVDPDYNCTPVASCCNQPASSCGCRCNQTLKTCNSQ